MKERKRENTKNINKNKSSKEIIYVNVQSSNQKNL